MYGSKSILLFFYFVVQQFEQGGVPLSKKYLPAVLAVIVTNCNSLNNTELVKKAYQVTEHILTTAAFNGTILCNGSCDLMCLCVAIVVELRELTLYLHQSGIVDLHWHTDHRAYRVNSGLKLMLTILYKCKIPLKSSELHFKVLTISQTIICP